MSARKKYVILRSAQDDKLRITSYIKKGDPLVRALVYDDSVLGPTGRGTSKEGILQTLAFFSPLLAKVGRITLKELLQGKLQKGDLFILPGGRDKPYHSALKGEGNKTLEEFARTGGSILGICAGAYYFGREVRFSPKNPLFSVHEKRSLAFYPGAVIGPALGDKDYSPFTTTGIHAASIIISKQEKTLKSLYNGGGYFEALSPLPPSVQILARYEENNEAAIVKIKYGEGLVILSGVHFEYNSKTFFVPDKRVRSVKEELLPSHKEVVRFIKSLLSLNSL